MSINPNVPNQKFNDTSMLADSEDQVLFSPYYERENHHLAAGDKYLVQLGGLYMMDDSGGIVTQIQNTQSNNPVSGEITIAGDFGGNAVIENKGPVGSVSAISYKFIESDPSISERTSNVVSTTTGYFVKIKNLTRIRKDGLKLPELQEDRARALKVKTGDREDDHFYVYNVANRNGQLVIVHTEEPVKKEEYTDTEVNGMVYVEYKSKVFIGILEKTGLSIYDPNGYFRFDSSQTSLSA